MKQNWISHHWWLPVLFAGIGLSSFTLFDLQDNASVNPPRPKFKVHFAQLPDTIPPATGEEDDDWGYQFNTGELDKAIKDMEREIERAKKEFNNRDLDKIDLEMKKAMKEMERVDMNKLKREMEESLKKVDWEKMQREIKESLKELETEIPKMKKRMEEDLSVEMERAAREMEKTQREIESTRENLKKELGQSLKETMMNMDKALENAKTELKELKKMTGEMEKDGLIKKGENAKIKFKDGELYINNKKQPQEVSEKYKRYFKNRNLRINLTDGDDKDDWI
jgi:uncharacterized protein (DUF885 family)